MKQAHPAAAMEVWAQDEHRVGLLTVLRRVWARRAQRPRAEAQHRYVWTYVYGFVEPATGRTWWLLLPHVNTAMFSLALAAFAAAQGLGPRKRIVLLLDGAGWHTSGHLVVPEGLHLVFQPAYSPELQPSERLWPLCNEALANQAFADLRALEDRLAARCRALDEQPELIRGTTLYHWWPVRGLASQPS